MLSGGLQGCLWGAEQQGESPAEGGLEGLVEEQHGPGRCKGTISGEDIERVGSLKHAGGRKGGYEYNLV